MTDTDDPQHDARQEQRRQRHEDDPREREWVHPDGTREEIPTRAEAEADEA